MEDNRPCPHCAERIAFLETQLVLALEKVDYERAQRAAEREAHAAAMELVQQRDARNTIEVGG